MPGTESDHHRGDAAVARLDLLAPLAAPATTTSSYATATVTARDEDEEDGFTFAAAAAALAVAVAIPRLQDADCAFPGARRVRASPVYPVFGRPRWSLPKQQQQQQGEEVEEEDPAAAGTATVRVPLERLLVDEQWCNDAPSASGQQPADDADDADAELDGVPAETYCLWYPGAGSRRTSPARCWKSGSTGSPVLRWRRQRQRRRSHSDGKDEFVFLGTRSDSFSAGEGHGWINHNHGSAATGGGGKSSSTAFLPCKQDLVELVASAVTCRRSCFLF